MPMTRPYWLHALTGVHIGAGTGVGAVDLPIVRERISEWPYVPGTSVKGVLSAHHGADDDDVRRKNPQLRAAFGVADDEGKSGSNSGALIFTDARLVCLPVPSFHGTFAWTTSRLALHRLARDLRDAGVAGVPAENAGNGDRAEVAEGTVLTNAPQTPAAVFLADLDFAASTTPFAGQWAAVLASHVFPADAVWTAEFQKRFVILPDDAFSHFARYGCEIVPRIRISPDTKTVAKGQLWLEELLPAESILAGLTVCDKVFHEKAKFEPRALMDAYCHKSEILQFGGKATTGRGRTRVLFSNKGGK